MATHNGLTGQVTPRGIPRLVVNTVASPICYAQGPCPRAGRAVLGPPIDHGDCLNRAILCVTCGLAGVESISTEADHA